MTGLQEAILYSAILAVVSTLSCWIMCEAERLVDAHFNRFYIPYCLIIWLVFSAYWLAPYL